jgi:hypothetical protein
MSGFTQSDLDGALLAIALFADGKIGMDALQRAMSYELGVALSQTGLARFRVTQMVSGRYRFRFTGHPNFSPEGYARLEALLGE